MWKKVVAGIAVEIGRELWNEKKKKRKPTKRKTSKRGKRK